MAESGISSPVDVKRYVAEGARAVLVGEALVKDGDPAGAVRAMTGITASTPRKRVMGALRAEATRFRGDPGKT